MSMTMFQGGVLSAIPDIGDEWEPVYVTDTTLGLDAYGFEVRWVMHPNHRQIERWLIMTYKPGIPDDSTHHVIGTLHEEAIPRVLRYVLNEVLV